MNCSEARYYTPLKLTGELEGALLQGYDEHLRQCVACNQLMENDAELDSALRLAADDADTSAVRERVLAEVHHEPRALPHASRRSWIVGGVSAAVVAILVLVLVIRQNPSATQLTIYRDAADDHRAEVAGHMKLRWERDMAGIQGMLRKVSADETIVDKIAPAGFHIDRARVCKLLSHRYVHLVYTDGQHELSFFVGPRNGDQLTGNPLMNVNGKAIHVDAIRDIQVAGFESDGLTLLLVSDEPVQQLLEQISSAADRV